MKPIPADQITNVWEYLQTIDWTDPWLSGLGAFHVLCVGLTILTYNYGALQAVYFAFLLLAVFFAENINEWAAENYRLFSREQYFDSNGFFISVTFSVPLLINCLVIVIMWLWNTGNLMVMVKKLKHRKDARLQREMEKNKTE